MYSVFLLWSNWFQLGLTSTVNRISMLLLIISSLPKSRSAAHMHKPWVPGRPAVPQLYFDFHPFPRPSQPHAYSPHQTNDVKIICNTWDHTQWLIYFTVNLSHQICTSVEFLSPIIYRGDPFPLWPSHALQLIGTGWLCLAQPFTNSMTHSFN